jgi:acetylornithine deacetylase/succinyl-diaminopimelate desuccinylase-like protein
MRSLASPQPDPAAIARLSNTVRYNALMRTTCVATMLSGGHAVNALPQTARASVNCRILPGEPVEEVQKTLARMIADEQVSVTPTGTPVLSPPSPLNPQLMRAVERLTAEFWPGIPVIPTMLAAATDGSFLRNAGIPTYGHSGLANDVNDVRVHGRDERILVKSFHDGHEYLYRLVKALSSD